MADINLEEALEQLKKFGDTIGKLNDTLDKFAEAASQSGDENKKAGEKVRSASDILKNQLASGVNELAKQTVSAGTGLSRFNGGINQITGSVGDFAGSLQFANKGLTVAAHALGGFVKVIGAFVGAGLKQNDDLMKSYQALSDMGSVTAGGLEGLSDQLHRVGLVAEEAEKFERVLKPITQQMVQFGGSLTAGRDKLVGVVSGLIGPNNEFERSLMRLGYTTQDIREGAADYLQRQSRLGFAQTKSVEQLRSESAKYLVTMKELQELTGMTRDEQKRARDAQLADARFSLHLAGMNQKEAENLQNYLIAYEKQFGKNAAAGLKDRIVNEGRTTTDLAAASFQSAQGAYDQAIKAQKGGTAVMMDSLRNTAIEIKGNVDRLRGTFMLQEGVLNDMALSSEAVNGALGLINTNTKNYAKTQDNLKKIMSGNGEMLEDNIVNEQKLRAIRIAADEALVKASGLTVGMFTKLIEIGYKFAKFLATVIDKISPYIPGMKATNLASQFRDLDDVAEEKKVAEAKISTLTEQLLQAQKTQVAMEQGKVNWNKAISDEKEKYQQLLKQFRETTNKEEKENLERQINSSLAKQRDLEESRRKDNQLSQMDRDRLLHENKAKIEQLQKDLERAKKEEDELTEEEISLAKKQIPGFGVDKNIATKVEAAGTQGMEYDQPGTRVSEEKLKARKAAAAGLGAGVSETKAQEILDKLDFGGKRKERTGGGTVDTALIDLANKVNERFPGSVFTAMNDYFHRIKRPNSRHTQGKAFDFVPPNPPKTPEEADEIKNALKDLGASKVLDEYFRDKNDNTKGGHFHVEIARRGGFFQGPEAGFPVMLHGAQKESVWPERDLKEMLGDVQKTSLEQYKDKIMNDINVDVTSRSTSTDNTPIIDALMTFIEKADVMIDELRRSNNTQQELLTYTKT